MRPKQRDRRTMATRQNENFEGFEGGNVVMPACDFCDACSAPSPFTSPEGLRHLTSALLRLPARLSDSPPHPAASSDLFAWRRSSLSPPLCKLQRRASYLDVSRSCRLVMRRLRCDCLSKPGTSRNNSDSLAP